MNKTQSQPYFEKERKRTDHSLDVERDKTNESLNEIRNEAELKADALTEALRGEADLAISKQRTSTAIEVNSAEDILRRQTEQLNVDQIVNQERERADLKVEDNSARLSTEIAEHLKTKMTLTSRDEFLAIVSHDLRNPIGAASSCAEMLLEDAAYSHIPPEVRTWIQFIKRNSDTALRLIGDLLDMEQVAEGKLQIKFGSYEIGQIIRESIESYAQLASAKSILLRLMPSDISGEIVCDRDRISQVICNLIGNAIKFTPEGGSVVLNANFSDSELHVSVRDSGPGIADDMRERIFERFVQLASSDRRGLGLGLYISKLLVEAHQGRLWVQSNKGEGSVFYFALPRRQLSTRI